jgi:hypothetical protein
MVFGSLANKSGGTRNLRRFSARAVASLGCRKRLDPVPSTVAFGAFCTGYVCTQGVRVGLGFAPRYSQRLRLSIYADPVPTQKHRAGRHA